ncbi:hypothetical protein V8F20_010105 [Naviculisporaceae sp. PSN 640]
MTLISRPIVVFSYIREAPLRTSQLLEKTHRVKTQVEWAEVSSEDRCLHPVMLLPMVNNIQPCTHDVSNDIGNRRVELVPKGNHRPGKSGCRWVWITRVLPPQFREGCSCPAFLNAERLSLSAFLPCPPAPEARQMKGRLTPLLPYQAMTPSFQFLSLSNDSPFLLHHLLSNIPHLYDGDGGPRLTAAPPSILNDICRRRSRSPSPCWVNMWIALSKLKPY